jgi:hypothetical protein
MNIQADAAKSLGGGGSIEEVQIQRRDIQETRPGSSSSSFLNVRTLAFDYLYRLAHILVIG